MNAAAVQDPPDFEGVALAAGAQEIEVQAGFRLEILKENEQCLALIYWSQKLSLYWTVVS